MGLFGSITALVTGRGDESRQKYDAIVRADPESKAAYITWQSKSGVTSVVRFDVITSEVHTTGLTITDHNVEKGADISDHARKQLDRLTLEGFISNTPIDRARGQVEMVEIKPEKYGAPLEPTPGSINNAIGGLMGAGLALITGGPAATKVEVLKFGDHDFVAEQLKALQALQDAPQFVTVKTSSRDYENMIVESVEMTRNKDTGTGATFTVGLRQIRTVETKLVDAPKPSILGAAKKVNKGAQGTKPVVDKSVAAKGYDGGAAAIKGLLGH